MAKKWTKQQLDKTFEEFLKESITDSDVTESTKKSKKGAASILDRLGQTPSPPSSGRSSGKQWWLNDDEEDYEYAGNSTSSFLKTKDTLLKDSIDVKSGKGY